MQNLPNQAKKREERIRELKYCVCSAYYTHPLLQTNGVNLHKLMISSYKVLLRSFI
mgnify:CR=1 FL=1